MLRLPAPLILEVSVKGALCEARYATQIGQRSAVETVHIEQRGGFFDYMRAGSLGLIHGTKIYRSV